MYVAQAAQNVIENVISKANVIGMENEVSQREISSHHSYPALAEIMEDDTVILERRQDSNLPSLE